MKFNGINVTWFFSHRLPKLLTYFYGCHINGASMIFPNSYAATENQANIAQLYLFWGTLIKDALPTGLPQQQL